MEYRASSAEPDGLPRRPGRPGGGRRPRRDQRPRLGRPRRPERHEGEQSLCGSGRRRVLRGRRLERAPPRVCARGEVGRLAAGLALVIGVPLDRLYQAPEEGRGFGNDRAVRGQAAPLEGSRVEPLEEGLHRRVARPPARRRREGRELCKRHRLMLAQHAARHRRHRRTAIGGAVARFPIGAHGATQRDDLAVPVSVFVEFRK